MNALYYLERREYRPKCGRWLGMMPNGKLQCSGTLEGAKSLLMSLPKEQKYEYAIFHRGKRLI